MGFATWVLVSIALDLFMYVSTLLSMGRGADPWWWTRIMIGGFSAYCGTYAAAYTAPAGKPAVAGAMAGLFGALAVLIVVGTGMVVAGGQGDGYLVVTAASTIAGAVGSVVAVVHTFVEHGAGSASGSE